MNAAINAKNTEDNNILIFHLKTNDKLSNIKPTQWREVSRQCVKSEQVFVLTVSIRSRATQSQHLAFPEPQEAM